MGNAASRTAERMPSAPMTRAAVVVVVSVKERRREEVVGWGVREESFLERWMEDCGVRERRVDCRVVRWVRMGGVGAFF